MIPSEHFAGSWGNLQFAFYFSLHSDVVSRGKCIQREVEARFLFGGGGGGRDHTNITCIFIIFLTKLKALLILFSGVWFSNHLRLLHIKSSREMFCYNAILWVAHWVLCARHLNTNIIFIHSSTKILTYIPVPRLWNFHSPSFTGHFGIRMLSKFRSLCLSVSLSLKYTHT